MLLGVDVGGTFTDAVLTDGRSVFTAKRPTTPDDQSEGVMAAVDAVLDQAGAKPTDVETFAHGMTVATNALLEGRAARTVLVATEGFTDVVELGRQARPDLYRLCAAGPAPLAPPELRVAAPERMGPDGALEALGEDGARTTADAVAALEPEAVAVVLLHSYRHPEHERALGERLATALPNAHISLSHEVTGRFREFERAATTEVDAALSPLLSRYLRQLLERAEAAGLPEPAIMQSSGGLADADLAARHAALTVLSGPAAGGAGAAAVATAAAETHVLCFDMGGTSCDVCVIEDGRVRETAGREVGDRPIALPMLDLHTVGAGGGSIGWRDAGGALRVGPRSAGARPGPACYGRGGTEPTVTDANLLLGYLPADGRLAGGVALDRTAAQNAVASLARELHLEPLACAEGIVRVANAEMVRALRVMTVERGVDPRGYALLPFGGAGPIHAAAIADELGMDRILCPRASGVLAAFGLVVSDHRRDAQRSVLLSGHALSDETVQAGIAELAEEARNALGGGEAETEATAELRYAGQAFELAVPAGGRPSPEALRQAFDDVHQDRYGYADTEADLELVTLRVTARRPGPDVHLSAGAPAAPDRTERDIVFSGAEISAAVLTGDLPPGTAIQGPAVCELRESTLLVPPGWSGSVQESGTVLLKRSP